MTSAQNEPLPTPAAPPRPRTAPPVAPDGRGVTVAPSWRRLLAGAIDAVGLVTVWFLGALAITSAGEPVQSGPWNLLDQLVDYVNARPTAVALAAALFAGLLFLLPFLFERFGRGTPGKRVLGLTLVDARGERPSPGRLAAHAALRVVGTLLLAIGPLSGLVDPDRRTLYDRLAGIYVIVS
ncbi:MAG: RDD family protein [Myxococcales bacterium]|nr:RDD family protein [Myxococcales bacterium]MCB9735660.1 RDD family protein [Deltaproteobacteria bacterium]